LFILLVFVLLINSFGVVYFTGVVDTQLTQIGIPVWAELSEQIIWSGGGDQPHTLTPFEEEDNPAAGKAIEAQTAESTEPKDVPIFVSATDSWNFMTPAPTASTFVPRTPVPATPAPAVTPAPPLR